MSYTVICRNENFSLLQLQGFVSVAQAAAALTDIAATVHVLLVITRVSNVADGTNVVRPQHAVTMHLITWQH